ncbi:hypothetical protein L9F63_020568, partial [Diploptera punctata]
YTSIFQQEPENLLQDHHSNSGRESLHELIIIQSLILKFKGFSIISCLLFVLVLN